ncbi:unnamed protein product [Oppiella nova]|uniref:Protein kinase domain-containing protein n=1 Tax=Oppiella nova TaxID=334625 RepID=A0A7R9QGK9_9ACAR|nr:unnamed protein product [Oppiella nova]CAG2165448.1 unnamed protein product [Oppiella nova]
MELCSWNNQFYNLHDLITLLQNAFKRKQDAELCPVEYFIAHTLLEELVVCLNVLQSHTPPIIHRDLKPKNILVTGSGSNWLKIGDFGLAKIQESNTQKAGALDYRAVEIIM